MDTTMKQTLRAEHTEADLAEAQDIATAMTDAMPDGIKPPMVIGALSLLTIGAFTTVIKAEFRGAAFDQFAAHCRAMIEPETRQ